MTAELRETAQKVKIKDILNFQNKISRVNLFATVINSPVKYPAYSQIIVDDGSGSVAVKNFDDIDFFEEIDIGDVILIMGKPRDYNNEKYIAGEIIKKIENQKWLRVRELELKNKTETVKEENSEKQESETTEKNYDDILNTISGLDSGEGIDFDKLVSESKIDPNSINYLLEKGEIFFVKPGTVKILE